MAFHSLEEIQKSCREKNVLFWRAVLLEDMADRSVTETESMQSMQQMWTAMKSASEQYDRDTGYSASGWSEMMGAQMEEYRQSKEPLCGPFVSKVIARALEMGESNACMKRIVAAPTAWCMRGAAGLYWFPLYEEERVSEDDGDPCIVYRGRYRPGDRIPCIYCRSGRWMSGGDWSGICNGSRRTRVFTGWR